MNLELVIKTIDLIDKEIEFVPLTNGIDLLPSYRKYYLSRVASSLIPSAISFLKLAYSRKITFKQIKELQNKSNFLSLSEKESEYIQILVLLRISMEYYSELALIENTDDIETACKNKTWHEFMKERENIRKNIRSFYDIESPSFEKYSNDGKLKFTNLSSFAYNKSIAVRFKNLFNDSNLITRRLLGIDYYNLYSFLSKKVHYDQRNNLGAGAPPELYYFWFYNFFVRASNILLTLNDSQGEKISFLENEITNLNVDLIEGTIALKIGSAVKTEFGLGHVLEIFENKPGLFHIKISYDYSRFVNPGFIDIIPAPLVSLFTEESLDKIQAEFTNTKKFKTFNTLFADLQKSTFDDLIRRLFYIPTQNCYGK
ncbi:hypothetical protein P3G55_22080 [Leptospira sp. 96542]|nr:hypothetical protein [Leptospira sp. 96542]